MHDPEAGLFGREPELARLQDAIDGLSRGRPTFLLVTGEAGIGKTRLLRAAVARADAAGVRALWGTAIESGQSIPYLPLLAPLRAAIGEAPDPLRRAPGADDAVATLRRSLIGAADSAVDPPHGPSLDTASFMEAVFDILGRRPTVLVVDDVQWADASTLTLLDYLAHRANAVPLAVVVGARDEEPATLARLPIADGRHFEQLAVGRLSRDDVGRLAVELVGTGVAGRRTAALHRRTAGNPFFLEQLLADGAAASEGRDGAHRVPGSLRTLVMRRVTGLDRRARRALEALAIIGRPAAPALVARVAGLSQVDAEAALQDAIAAGVLVPDEAGVSMRHPLYGEVIEAELSGPARRDLHAMAASVEEAVGGDAVVTANHWWHAGDRPRAWATARVAASSAERSFAFAEVRLHLERAIATWPTGEPGKADACVAAGRAAWLAGDPVAALDLARAADAIDPGRVETVISIGAYAWDAGSRPEAVESFARASSLLGPDASAAVRSQAAWGLGRATVAAGRPEEAVHHGLTAARLAREAGDPVLESEGLALAAMSAAFAGRLEGVAWLDTATDLALRSGATYRTGHAFQFLVDLRALSGASDAALADARRGIEACNRLGLGRTHGSDLRGRAALLLIDRGRLDDAASVLDAADDRAYPSLARGFLAMRRGDLDEAATELDAAAVGGAIGGPGALGGWLELARVELAWLCGDAAAVARWLDAVPDVPGVWGTEVRAWVAWWRSGRGVTAGRAQVSALLDAAATHPDPRVAAALVAEVRAATHTAGDADEDGAAAWAAAARAWADAERPWEAAWAQLAEARALFADRRNVEGKTILEVVVSTAAAIGTPPLRSGADDLARRARIRVGAPPRPRAQPDAPTERELEVLELLADGLTNRQIAERLFLSPKTVGIHVSRLLEKLGAHTRGEAVAVARRRGLVG